MRLRLQLASRLQQVVVGARLFLTHSRARHRGVTFTDATRERRTPVRFGHELRLRLRRHLRFWRTASVIFVSVHLPSDMRALHLSCRLRTRSSVLRPTRACTNIGLQHTLHSILCELGNFLPHRRFARPLRWSWRTSAELNLLVRVVLGREMHRRRGRHGNIANHERCHVRRVHTRPGRRSHRHPFRDPSLEHPHRTVQYQ